MPWEGCFRRATDGIRQERYISIQFISKVLFRMSRTANATSKTAAELLIFLLAYKVERYLHRVLVLKLTH